MAAPPTTPPATITISDHFPNPYNDLYDVTFSTPYETTTIITTVTDDPNTVTNWLNSITTRTSQPRVIGLDVEWRPNFSREYVNPVATLQLCTNNSCLIYHIIHSQGQIPWELKEFLGDDNNTFVGAGIVSDVEKLLGHYNLWLAKTIDLGSLARYVGVNGLNPNSSDVGLTELGRVVLGVDVQKPRSVTLSQWDQVWLSYPQIQYACIDAYVSYQVGVSLDAGRC